MAIQADWKYNVTVTSASLMKSAKKGTPGLQLSLETEDGDTIEHVLYLTDSTKVSTAKALVALGVKGEDIRKKIFWENVGSILPNHKGSITTIEETWQGKSRIKVQWINEPISEAGGTGTSEEIAADAVSLFDDGPVPF
jgi:hypothetical protein